MQYLIMFLMQMQMHLQTASDGGHEFDGSVQNTSLTTSSETNQIQNPVGALRTINLTDANYANLPIESASITLTN